MIEQEPHRTLNALPRGSRIYTEGFAVPFYVQTPLTYHTCWDASPIAPALRSGGVTEARRWLKSRGFTHVLIDMAMIDLWLSPGNYGFDLRREEIQALAEGALRPVDHWGGLYLFAVR